MRRFTIATCEFVHPDDREPHAAAYAGAVAGQEHSCTCRYLTETHGDRWVVVTFTPLTNGDGQPVRIRSQVRDIHNEYVARRQQHESESRFHAFMNNSPFTAYMKNQDGQYVYVNSTFERVFDVDGTWLTGRTVSEWMGPEVAERVERNDRKVLDANRPEEFIDTVPGRDGTPQTWFSLRFPFTALSGQRFVGGVSLDVTERVNHDLERMRLAAIVETSQDSIYSTDLTGRIISWNPAAELLYGYTVDEMLGVRMEILVPEAEREDLPRLRALVARGERIDQYETRRVTRVGRVIDVALTFSPIRNSDGSIIGASTITRDITERKRLLEERRQLYDELQEEVNRAAEIQAHLLPRFVPHLPGFKFAAICLPAREMGGDFFDWASDSDTASLSLGDVTGKGMSAALLMATARAALRSVADLPIAEAMTAVNRALIPDLSQSDSFVTLFHAAMQKNGQLTYADAGHGLAMIVWRDGTVEPLQQRKLPIGILPDTEYEESVTWLEPGDMLVVYSDGLPDSRTDLDLYDFANVAAQIAGEKDVNRILDRLVTLAQTGGARNDDMTLIVVRREEEDDL